MLSPVNRLGGDRHSRIVRSIRGGRPHRGRKDDQGASATRRHGEHGGRIPPAASMQAIKRPEVLADLVGTVSFLTSDDAAFMTGAPAGVLAFSFLSDIASPGPRKSAPRSPDALQPWAGP